MTATKKTTTRSTAKAKPPAKASPSRTAGTKLKAGARAAVSTSAEPVPPKSGKSTGKIVVHSGIGVPAKRAAKKAPVKKAPAKKLAKTAKAVAKRPKQAEK